MDNEIMTIQGVRVRLGADGIGQLNAADVAVGLGFVDYDQNGFYVVAGKRHFEPCEIILWEQFNKSLANHGYSKEVDKDDFIPENLFYRLASESLSKTALEFQSKVTEEVLPALRLSSMRSKSPTPYADKLIGICEIARVLEKYIPGLESNAALAQAIALAEANSNFNYDPIKKLVKGLEDYSD